MGNEHRMETDLNENIIRVICYKFEQASKLATNKKVSWISNEPKQSHECNYNSSIKVIDFQSCGQTVKRKKKEKQTYEHVS